MAGEEAANAKRKREDGSERKSKAARHSSARQERLEAEFGELYFGPTSLYKLLELRQLQQPALLPRSLSYRLLAARKSAAAGSSIEGDKANNKTKKKNEKKKREEAAVVGATMREIKLAITADLTQSLAKENGQLGLRLAIYTAKGRSFEDNLFTPIAECMIPGRELWRSYDCLLWIAKSTDVIFLFVFCVTSALLQERPYPEGDVAGSLGYRRCDFSSGYYW